MPYALPFLKFKGAVAYIGCRRLLAQSRSLCLQLALTLIPRFRYDRVYVCGTEFSAVRCFYRAITIATVHEVCARAFGGEVRQSTSGSLLGPWLGLALSLALTAPQLYTNYVIEVPCNCAPMATCRRTIAEHTSLVQYTT